jgi:nitrogenase molybdenum-iron protein NifN
MPIGISSTDKIFNLLETLSGKKTPQKYINERGRLIDSYFDSHKYVFGKKAVVYGEADFVTAMAAFLEETGIKPVLCATGDMDFMDIAENARILSPDLIIGNSKGYPLSRELNIPHIRVGFPIHDRVGGQRILHLGYRGAHDLFDAITNSLIKHKQDTSPVGYMYM